MDSNNDGIGDLPGIAQKLEHVAALGADAIWISPFFKSPMKDFGYDVSDYKDVDPVFGTLKDFKTVLDRAHTLGLKVIIDQVWSHTSDQHAWFAESRRSKDNARHDWYVWADPKPDGTAPNNWLSYFGGPAWTWDSRRCQYYLHHFLKEQPTLNLWNSDVRAAIKDTAAFWLDMGVDGFRLDVAHGYLYTPGIPDNPARSPNDPLPTDMSMSNPMTWQRRIHSMNVPENLDWIAELRAFVNKWPQRCLLGEVGGDDSEREAVVYTQTGKRLHLAYSFGLVGSAMTEKDIRGTVSRVQELIGDGWMCWAISNHDFKRVASRLNGSAPRADKALFATILGLCLRGSYCLYQGEELGLPQAELTYEELQDPYDKVLYPEHTGRDGCRTPMPWQANAPQAGFSGAVRTWLPVSPLHVPLSVDAQMADKESMLNKVRTFLAWRKNTPALQVGDFAWIDTSGPVVGFRRFCEGKSIACFFNPSDREESFPAAIVKTKTMNDQSRHGIQDGALVRLGPFGYAFFEEVGSS